MKSRYQLRKDRFQIKVRMINFNLKFKKALGSGKVKDLIKAGKILSDVNRMITENFFLQFSAKPKNF
jgi:hypothetical protein